MTSRRLLILGALAIVALAASLLLSNQRSSSQQESATTLYPQLKQQINSINAVRLFKAGDARAVELLRKDSGWIVSESHDYPADPAKVHRLLLALAQAKTVEQKTSNPRSYATLGVADLSDVAAAGTGVRVELAGAAPADLIANLIIGKSAGAQSTYVRRAGEPASWLVDQRLDASTNPRDWLHTAIIDVTADRVQSATIAISGAKAYSASKNSRADADFTVDGLPRGRQLDSPAANGLSSALAGLTLTDVRPLKDFADKPAAHTTLRTFDGLVADLDGWVRDSKHYIAVKTAYDAALAQRFHLATKAPAAAAAAPTAASAQPQAGAKPVEESSQAIVADGKLEQGTAEDAANAANARLTGWAFEIPEYKYAAIFKPLEQLLQAK